MPILQILATVFKVSHQTFQISLISPDLLMNKGRLANHFFNEERQIDALVVDWFLVSRSQKISFHRFSQSLTTIKTAILIKL